MITHRKQVKSGDRVFFYDHINGHWAFGTVVGPHLAKIKWKKHKPKKLDNNVFEREYKNVNNLYAIWDDHDDMPRFIKLSEFKVYPDTPITRTLYMENISEE
jgi:hypothetical protein